jgi:hypothetical protein
MRCMRTGSGPKASMTSPLNRRLEPCSEPAGRPRSTEDVWQSPRFHLPPRHEGTLRIRRHGTGASMGQSQAARSAAVQVRQSFTDQRAGLDAPSGSAFRSLGCMCLDVCMQPLRADVVIMGSGMGWRHDRVRPGAAGCRHPGSGAGGSACRGSWRTGPDAVFLDRRYKPAEQWLDGPAARSLPACTTS